MKMKKKLVSILLVLVMVLNIAPIAVSADTVEEAAYTATFLGHSAQVSNFKLYTYAAGVKGETNLLDGVTDSDESNIQKYVKELAAGDYWLEGYDEAGDYSGGMKITVTADGTNEFNVQRAYQLKASNSGWVLGTDYTISAEVSDADRNVHEIEMGTAADYDGNQLPSCICLYGDTVTVTYTPTEVRVAENYIETFKTNTLTSSSSSFSMSIPQAVEVTFDVPEGSVVSAGRFHTYYIYDFAEPKTVETPEGENAAYTFMIPKSTPWFYRVQNPKGVTYWNYASWKEDTTVTVTAEDLYIGSEDFTKDTIYRYEKNVYDKADIYLNINGKGYLDLAVGESYELNVFRNWMAIESFINSKVGLPDMHYEVVDVEGNPSDVLTITPNEKNSSVADMKANKEGTAIVKVTYDAMTHIPGQGGKQFSAIWPECTGVFIVTVGAGEVNISTGMMMERYSAADTAIDAEHDILFYLKSETSDPGAEFTFAPEEGTTVTVNRSSVGSSMEFDGFDSTGVTTNEDGTVTVTGLTTGRHIIKVEKAGKATYQVVTARGVSYELQDAQGKALTEEQISALKAGDTVYIQYNNLVNPAEKLSGAYNFNAAILYYGEDGTSHAPAAAAYGQYDFSGNPARQKVTVKIPKYWNGTTYTLNGAIRMGGFANVPIGGHRGITYAKGLNAGYNAPSVGMILSRMPEITLNLQETQFLTGTLTFKDQNGNAISAENLTVKLTDASGNTLMMNADGTFPCLAEEYTYTVAGTGVEYATGAITVTEDGENTFEITLNKVADTAWDGMTATEPATDENGVYQIGTGNELFWIAQAVNGGTTTINAALTADINLAKYAWTPIGNSSKRFAGTFDGNGHTIENLYMNTDSDYVGLFGHVDAGSTIKNLKVSGNITSTYSKYSNPYAAGIVGNANGSSENKVTILNCINNVNVTHTNKKNFIAGVVAYGRYTNIENCANIADITSAGNYVGGIAGQLNTECSITASYNTGSISGAGYIGGVAGYATSVVTINAAYNTGTVTGTSDNVGGLVGYLNSKNNVINDCYNIGTVSTVETSTKVGSLFGVVRNPEDCQMERCYYLEGTAADANATVLTEEQMKEADLNYDYFVNTCGGYPAFVWQDGLVLHNGTVVETVAVNCTEDGYTVFTCSECEKTYKGEYVKALGHDWCEHENEETCNACVYTAPTCLKDGSYVYNCRFEGCEERYTEVIPATGHTEDETKTVTKDHCQDMICSVCGESYKVWDYELLQYMEGIDGILAADAAVEDGTYPWVYNAENARIESSNQNVGGSESQMVITFTTVIDSIVSFDYGVSSEAGWDKLTITANVGENTLKIADAVSGNVEESLEYVLEAGETYTLTFKYAKDGSGDSGSDTAWISNIKFVPAVDQAKEAAATAKEEAETLVAEAAKLRETADTAASAAEEAKTAAEEAKVAAEEAKTAAEADPENQELADAAKIAAETAATKAAEYEAAVAEAAKAEEAAAAAEIEAAAAAAKAAELAAKVAKMEAIMAKVEAEKAAEAAKADKDDAEAAKLAAELAKEAAELAKAQAEAERAAANEAAKAAQLEKEAATKEKALAKEAKDAAELARAAAELAKAAAEAAKTDAEKAKEEALKAKQEAIVASIGETDLTLANASTKSIKLTWDRLTGADGYIIWRAVLGGEFEQIKTVANKKKTAYTDKNLVCGTTYVYKIQGFKNVEEEVVSGEMSDEAKLKVKPAAAKLISVKAGKKKAVIRWKKVSGANGYVIYRATKKNGTYKKVKTIKKVSTVTWTNKKLKSGKKYYYKVCAFKTVDGKRVYGSYSVVKAGKIK